ncbi:hypothetical protein PF005_g559 [Phytophthora fragariae]|uniref:Uncharacterized protein n=1 Tax=Phytophthora fragariae TaxID=53985 RepID=A0A6A3ZN04_9STRA|nr:hypothetical protein PF011_g345 [Phytophthora fragariae]KAE9139128.1 hypothetical protein PF010_g712 [Phytophthora fragariae]KAE9140450.1 hypothetical protein PF007_g645 [Phytophthora fragariae]KAE9153206.1 hypothetical protein PF006_g2653 [Phytophthora fragariae]KAE9237655.1 hypothetical protein PF005_g559 [Phytophthora fragariae]
MKPESSGGGAGGAASAGGDGPSVGAGDDGAGDGAGDGGAADGRAVRLAVLLEALSEVSALLTLESPELAEVMAAPGSSESAELRAALQVVQPAGCATE